MGTGRKVGWALGAVGLCTLLAGCGDPPPKPSVAPVEVVLKGCQLNRPSVAAGVHDVSVIGTGSARILDGAGATVLERAGGEPSPAAVTMKAGTHTVQCRDSAGAEKGSATLTVTAE